MSKHEEPPSVVVTLSRSRPALELLAARLERRAAECAGRLQVLRVDRLVDEGGLEPSVVITLGQKVVAELYGALPWRELEVVLDHALGAPSRAA